MLSGGTLDSTIQSRLEFKKINATAIFLCILTGIVGLLSGMVWL